MFEDIARTWLSKWEDNRNDNPEHTYMAEDIVSDLAFTLMQVYEAGRDYGYDEGLEENLTELQW